MYIFFRSIGYEITKRIQSTLQRMLFSNFSDRVSSHSNTARAEFSNNVRPENKSVTMVARKVLFQYRDINII